MRADLSDDTTFAPRASIRPSRGTSRLDPPPPGGPTTGVYTGHVVIFFEVLLVLASILIAWFSLYVVYRLVTDES